MSYFKINDSALSHILINRHDRYKLYPEIDHGAEGVIYKYNEDIAIKIFEMSSISSKENKFNKIEKLAKINDSSFTFPIGLVGFEDATKEGYYMKLVHCNPKVRNYYELSKIDDLKYKYDMVIKASIIMKRIHKTGIIIGDMKSKNIVIDLDDNPIYVDTDNFCYEGTYFDIEPFEIIKLREKYNKEFSLKDINKVSYAKLGLETLFPTLYGSDFINYLEEKLSMLDVTEYVKEGLRLIFSDASDKPYLDEVLEGFDYKSLALKYIK